ncbi:Transcriptional regulatory protein ZraR [Sedimentisphaera cyanobacteriorum]|uniref:Transcriptional regulatory protein ZraR n=1 Tax=Sedimentisphaera cyanobacteriorum TaxID=1940790 RepID=A0A1Q2HQ70_9BACT|nr:sigma-54 dependent transcriptional regulator [Sedimentisphaera cyanobacteriorum]AQQ09602.1 Transcriptional regulatory protein ZraR [Sedimentisphaera cyanobacteriorum]
MKDRGITVLIVDEKSRRAERVGSLLEGLCERVYYAQSAEDAANVMNRVKAPLVLTDMMAGAEIDGFELIKGLRRQYRAARFVMLASSASIDACKKALWLGAYDFLERPVSRESLEKLFEGLNKSFSLSAPDPIQASPAGQTGSERSFYFEGVKSKSPAMRHIYKVISKAAPTNLSVLIEGESGTGKELTARAIHMNSNRAGNEFRPINCAGLNESLLESELFGHVKGAFTGAATDRKGLFEVGDKGTLFLDEIGDMPMSMQAKLLRVLEDGIIIPVGSNKPVRVDVRVVSATNCDLAKLVEEKKFREDLYFRIKGVSIVLPPLRSRQEDIPDLLYYFLEQACSELGVDTKDISKNCMDILLSYPWPGNIRELRNVVRTTALMSESDVIEPGDVPPEVNSMPKLSSPKPEPAPKLLVGQSLEEIEKQAIESTLEMTEGNREKASRILGIGERTLYRKIKEYGLS